MNMVKPAWKKTLLFQKGFSFRVYLSIYISPRRLSEAHSGPRLKVGVQRPRAPKELQNPGGGVLFHFLVQLLCGFPVTKIASF